MRGGECSTSPSQSRLPWVADCLESRAEGQMMMFDLFLLLLQRCISNSASRLLPLTEHSQVLRDISEPSLDGCGCSDCGAGSCICVPGSAWIQRMYFMLAYFL